MRNSLRPKNVLPKQNELLEGYHTETDPKTTPKALSALTQLPSKHPSASRKEQSKNILGISKDGVKYNFKGLQQKDVIKRIGLNKGEYWEVVDKT